MLWGFLYEASIQEYGKRNLDAKTEIEINGIKAQVRILENEIIQLKKDISELQNLIDTLILVIENLKKQLEIAVTKPETLLRNMENFYAGWLQYLNGFNGNETKRTTCEGIYRGFHQSLNTQNLNLN